jgi:hypothetical protein
MVSALMRETPPSELRNSVIVAAISMGMSALCQKRTHALQQKFSYSMTSSASAIPVSWPFCG